MRGQMRLWGHMTMPELCAAWPEWFDLQRKLVVEAYGPRPPASNVVPLRPAA